MCYFAYTERAKRNTNPQRRDIVTAYALSRSRRRTENGRRRAKYITSASMGIRIKRRGNAETAPWSDRGNGQPVRQHANQKLAYTSCGKAQEGKGKHTNNGTTVRADPKKKKQIARKEHERVTSFSARLKIGRKQSWKENASNARPKGK